MDVVEVSYKGIGAIAGVSWRSHKGSRHKQWRYRIWFWGRATRSDLLEEVLWQGCKE
jgi:hypothetical protein